jgi:sugar phosphate isomerase/epimerase
MGKDVELLGLYRTVSGPVDRLPGEGEFDPDGYIRVCEEHGYSGPWGVEVLSEQLRNQPLDMIFRRAYETTAAQFAHERSSA